MEMIHWWEKFLEGVQWKWSRSFRGGLTVQNHGS